MVHLFYIFLERSSKKMEVGCSSRLVIIPTCILFAVGTTASDRGGFVMLFTWYVILVRAYAG